MKRGWIILVAVVLLAIGGIALAQMGPGMMGGQRGQGQQQSPPMGPGMMGPGGMMGQGQQPGQPQRPGQQPGPGTMGPGMMGPGSQSGPGMMGPGGMMGGGMMGAGSTNDRPWITVMLDRREDLGLSAEQVGRLFLLRDRFTKEVQKKSETLEKVERELDPLIGPGAVDLKAVDAKLKEAEAIRTDLRLSRFKVIEEGKAVLTPEQRKKLVELAKDQQPSSLGPATERPMMGSGGSGMEEMQRFMQSDRAPQAMAAMMQMAGQMGNGDVMLGMVRMMEMMGSMGSMMGPGGQQ